MADTQEHLNLPDVLPGGEVEAMPGAGVAEPMDTAFEVELDDAPDGAVAPVTDGAGLPMPSASPTRLPVIPDHLRSVAAFRHVAAKRAGAARHHAAYHGFRSPLYALFSLWFALAGAGRVVAWLTRWWWVADAVGHMKSADADQWLKLHVHARQVRRTRGAVLGGGLLAVAAGCLLLALLAPWWGQLAAVLAALPFLAWAGWPKGKTVVKGAVTTPRFRLLNADVVLRAYYAAGLGHPDKAGQQVTFAPPGMARDGEGSRVLVDLPYGKGLDDAVKAKGSIASGLDVSVSQVFIHRDPSSHRRHVLWVADRDPLAVPVGRTPLLACKATDIWKPAPMGLDERGQLVTVPLMWNSVLVGALPRQGKTFSARQLALYAALDPYVKLSVFDGKGSPDWREFAQVADAFAFGLTPTKDGLPPEILLATLQEMRADVQWRYNRLSELAAERPDLCREGKLTRDLSRDPRFAMPVRMLVIDEVQEYFDLGDISKEIASLLVFMAKVAPGAGVSVMVSTQKPSGIGGSGTLAQQFISFRDQMAIRFSLRTSGYQVSEMVLGQGAYSEGLDSSALLPQYKGVGILRGVTDASPTVRTFLADGEDAGKILKAARSLRERAGTLSGMAAGESAGAAPRDVLGDLLAVFEGDPGLHWAEAAERLARRFEDRWADLSAEALSAQCRDLRVPSVDVKRAGVTLKGCRRADVETARGSR